MWNLAPSPLDGGYGQRACRSDIAGYFAVVGGSDGTHPPLTASPDSLSWDSPTRISNADSFYDVARSEPLGYFMAVGQNASTQRAIVLIWATDWTTFIPTLAPAGWSTIFGAGTAVGRNPTSGVFMLAATNISTNALATWNGTMSAGLPVYTLRPSPFDGGYVNSIDCSSAGRWIAVGSDSAGNPLIAYSDDEGATWTVIVTAPFSTGTGAYISRVRADDAHTQWFLPGLTDSGKVLAVSRDDGATWAEVSTPLDGGSGLDIVNLSGDAMELCGIDATSSNEMCVSTDAGVTWALDADPNIFGGNSANGLAYSAGLDTAIAVGNGATAIATTAGSVAPSSVTYDGNGADGGSPPADGSSPYAAGATVAVLGPGDLTLTGYTFAGWNTAADGSGTTYAPGDTFAMPGTDVILYAIWAPLPPIILPVPRCSYIVEAAWAQETAGLFRFGISRFGGPDRLAASSWSALFDGPYDDLAAIARTIGIQRGRDNDLTEFRAGQLDLSMRDAAGIYNPYNSSSPLVIGGNLDTDKPIRVGALIDGITYPLIYAFITDIEGDPSGYGTVQITAVDFLDKFDRQSPILTGLAPGLTDGQIIGLILDWYQWQEPGMRNLAVGDTINAAYTRADGSRSGLTLVAELMEAERGIAFVAASGAVTYIDRNLRYATTSLATIDRNLKAFPVGRSNSKVTNTWTVQRTDMAGNPLGAPQTAGDDVSERRHGPISQEITTPFLNTDAQALALAQYLVNRTKSGMSLVYDVPLSIFDKATLIQAVSREIGDRVTLTIEPRNMPSRTGDFYIEATGHTIDTAPGNTRHQTTWRVSECPTDRAFRFGISRFGGPDWLAY